MRRHIIDENKIEIGGRCHLASPETSHRNDAEFAAFDNTRNRSEFLFDFLQETGNRRFGDAGKSRAGLIG